MLLLWGFLSACQWSTGSDPCASYPTTCVSLEVSGSLAKPVDGLRADVLGGADQRSFCE